jgi:threonine/homoserine/homoserine lactone efflux protein
MLDWANSIVFASGVTASSLMSFMLATLLIELTPGPNMTYLAVATLKDGRRAGFVTVAGVALGLLIIGLVAALGLAAVIAASPALHDVLRVAGIIFFLYLAWDSWRDPLQEAEAAVKQATGRHFMRGLMSNLLNPKAAAFYVAVLPRFTDPAAGPLMQQTVALTLTYVAIASAVHAVIVAGAGLAQPFLQGPRERVTRRAMALLLVAVAAWFAWTTAR